jgi:hypothetical protein
MVQRQHRKTRCCHLLVLIVSSYATEVLEFTLFGVLWLSYYARRSKFRTIFIEKVEDGLDTFTACFFVLV